MPNEQREKRLPLELTDLSGLHGFVDPVILQRAAAAGITIEEPLIHIIHDQYQRECLVNGRERIRLVLDACRTKQDWDSAMIRLLLVGTGYEVRRENKPGSPE